jgi:uncharacterized membrane protein
MRTTARNVILIALLASFFSFIKFNHCVSIGWSQPGTDIHACYSDISALYNDRGLNTHKWPFSGAIENVVEYPALQGVAMWATSLFVLDDIKGFYYISIAFIIALFLISALIVFRIAPNRSFLYAIAPTGIAALFINWDMWAIPTMLLAIYCFDKKRYTESALILAVSVATKFFPLALLLPIAIIFIRKREIIKLVHYFATTIVTVIAINIPFAVISKDGWWRFFDLNIHRTSDWGSLWLGLEFSDIRIPSLNVFTILFLLVAIVVVALYMLSTVETLTLAQSAIFAMSIVMIVGKVYSPQYVLWLAPLVVIAIKSDSVIPFFWGWQITEIIYHLAIWLHLAGLNLDQPLIPQSFYVDSIFIRIAGLLAIAVALARQHRISPNFSREFLFESAGIYP